MRFYEDMGHGDHKYLPYIGEVGGVAEVRFPFPVMKPEKCQVITRSLPISQLSLLNIR